MWEAGYEAAIACIYVAIIGCIRAPATVADEFVVLAVGMAHALLLGAFGLAIGNPIVLACELMLKKRTLISALGCALAQLVGAFVGALITWAVFPSYVVNAAPILSNTHSYWTIIATEAVAMFVISGTYALLRFGRNTKLTPVSVGFAVSLVSWITFAVSRTGASVWYNLAFAIVACSWDGMWAHTVGSWGALLIVLAITWVCTKPRYTEAQYGPNN
jgi:hypothetical protein